MTTTPQPAAGPRDPLVPRPIDLPMVVPLAPDADLTPDIAPAPAAHCATPNATVIGTRRAPPSAAASATR